MDDPRSLKSSHNLNKRRSKYPKIAIMFPLMNTKLIAIYITDLFVLLKQHTIMNKLNSIGLYRENANAIESEARDPFGGNVYYVTMQITFPIPEFARKERNLHCDVVHVTTKWFSRLVLDHAIAAIQTSR